MKLEKLTLTTVVAIFVVVFGLVSLVFVHMEDIVLGLVGGYISAVIQFLYGSSKGSEGKDKTISDMSKNVTMNVPIDDLGGSNPPPPKKGEK